ncbi:hypothetical protein [Spiroplasma endosymbiont of Aspidapion aeneum]|uniref:hypothetical protein n=1 Tax=Spiroplasma endosymbiont of Aspidapion aeneum TaxID=3066276 RepID=UPI00313DD258
MKDIFYSLLLGSAKFWNRKKDPNKDIDLMDNAGLDFTITFKSIININDIQSESPKITFGGDEI